MKKIITISSLSMLCLLASLGRNEPINLNAYIYGENITRAEYIERGTKLNCELADEGFVLLKNDGTLPLRKGSKISVVGKSSIFIARHGSEGAGEIWNGITATDLKSSLTEAGFEVNENAISFYRNASGGRTNGNDNWLGYNEYTTGETPIDEVVGNADLISSFSDFNDLAIQVITRDGAENCDLLTIDSTDSVRFGESNKHELELSDNEQALYDELHNHFDHILILLNTPTSFECDQFMNDTSCCGVLWMGLAWTSSTYSLNELMENNGLFVGESFTFLDTRTTKKSEEIVSIDSYTVQLNSNNEVSLLIDDNQLTINPLRHGGKIDLYIVAEVTTTSGKRKAYLNLLVNSSVEGMIDEDETNTGDNDVNAALVVSLVLAGTILLTGIFSILAKKKFVKK